MPEAVITTLLSPSLSSDSSLSSAPEIGDFALEDTTNPLDLEGGRLEAIAHETTIEVSQSQKRRRTIPDDSIKSPAKRTKRETGTRPNHRAAIKQEVELENTEHENQLAIKRERKSRASVNGAKSITTKTELNGDIEVAVEAVIKKTRKSTKVKVGADAREEEVGVSRPKRPRGRGKASIEAKEAEEEDLDPETPKKSSKAKKAEVGAVPGQEQEVVDETPKKPKRKRKTKEEKEAEAMPLAVRTTALKVFIGAHVSAAKGLFALWSVTSAGSAFIASPRLKHLSSQVYIIP